MTQPRGFPDERRSRRLPAYHAARVTVTEAVTQLRSATRALPSYGRSGICTDQVWSMMRITARIVPPRLVQCTAAH